MKNKIINIFYYFFNYKVYKFIYFIKELPGWIVVLFNNEDMSRSGILKILKHKIYLMRKHRLKSELSYYEMLHVESLINKVLNKDFYKEERLAIKEKYGKMIIVSGNIVCEKGLTPEDTQKYRKEITTLSIKRHEEEKRYLNEIFDIIKDGYNGRWI